MGMPVTSGLNFPSLVNVWISPSFLKMWNLGVDSSFLSTLEKLYDIPFLLVSVAFDKTAVIQLVSPIFLSLHTRFCLCFWWEEQGKEHLPSSKKQKSPLSLYFKILMTIFQYHVFPLQSNKFYLCIYEQYSENQQASIEVHRQNYTLGKAKF